MMSCVYVFSFSPSLKGEGCAQGGTIGQVGQSALVGTRGSQGQRGLNPASSLDGGSQRAWEGVNK